MGARKRPCCRARGLHLPGRVTSHFSPESTAKQKTLRFFRSVFPFWGLLTSRFHEPKLRKSSEQTSELDRRSRYWHCFAFLPLLFDWPLTFCLHRAAAPPNLCNTSALSVAGRRRTRAPNARRTCCTSPPHAASRGSNPSRFQLPFRSLARKSSAIPSPSDTLSLTGTTAARSTRTCTSPSSPCLRIRR